MTRRIHVDIQELERVRALPDNRKGRLARMALAERLSRRVKKAQHALKSKNMPSVPGSGPVPE